MDQSVINLLLLLWITGYVAAVWQILNEKQLPSTMLLRLALVTAVPIFGSMLYFLFFFRRRIPRINQRLHDLAKAGMNAPADENSDEFTKFVTRLSHFSPTPNNHIEHLLDPLLALETICTAIQTAKHYVYVEYYIISSDKVARRITNELVKAKNRGVKVRIMYDVVGSRTFRGESAFFIRLKRKGLRILGFLPIRSFFHMFDISRRNHRKLLLIDGHTAFTGGTNIGIEYFGRWHNQQQYDFTFRLRGDVCKQLESVFAADWSFVAELEELPTSLPQFASLKPRLPDFASKSQVQIVPSGPDTLVPVFYSVVTHLLYHAQSSVCCITPYFIPTDGFRLALMNAVSRGVRVQLILPSKIDWMLVLYASRSYWDDLLSAGVEIYEFPPVLLHAKLMLIDDYVFLGSSNLDTRSFCLNFELDFLINDPVRSRDFKQLFQQEIAKSQKLDITAFRRRSQWSRMAENACRLFSPML